MNLKIYGPFFFPDAPAGGSGGSGGTGDGQSETSRDLADLGDIESPDDDKVDEGDDDKDDKDDEGEEKDDKEDESDEVDAEAEEDDEEEGDKKEDDTEEVEPQVTASYKDIKAKYPKLFKEFPQLKANFFIAQKFLEVFPDAKSAKEAVGKVEEYDNLEQSLVANGDPRLLVNTLSNNNPKALRKIVENFGEAVRTASRDDYIALSTPIIEELIYHAAAHGTKTGNKNLELAARHLANFVFANGGEIPDISKRAAAKEPSENEKQLIREREGYQQKEFNRALGDVGSAATVDIDRILSNKLDDLSPFEKKAVIKDARAEVDQTLSRDQEFQKKLRALWAKASESGYSDESKSRIKRAWLDRAKLIAPGIRNRLRQEALDAKNPNKGSSKKEGQKRSFVGSGVNVSGGKSRGFQDPKKIDWKKTSDRDILDS